MQQPGMPCLESPAIAPLELQHLPPAVVVAIYDCLAEAGEVVRAATVCKTTWNIVAAAQFTKVVSMHFKCFHPELQHLIPHLAQQLPAIQTLNLADCSALPEPWLQQAAAVWKVQDLDVTRMWHWTGSVCLPHWAGTLTRLVANDTSFPVVEVLRQPASAALKPVTAGSNAAGSETRNSVPAAAVRSSDTDDAVPPQQSQAGQQHYQQQGQQQMMQLRGAMLQPPATAAGCGRAPVGPSAASAGLAQTALGAAGGLSASLGSHNMNVLTPVQQQQQNTATQQQQAALRPPGLRADARSQLVDPPNQGPALGSQYQQNTAMQQQQAALAPTAGLATDNRSQLVDPPYLASALRSQYQQDLLPNIAMQQDHQLSYTHHMLQSSRQRGKQPGHPLAWVEQLRHLRELHLSGLMRDLVRCRIHGARECDCQEDTVLSTILSNNSSLTHLNLSNNPQLPDRLLHCALTSNAVGLRTLNLSGCDLIRPGYVGSCCFDLKHLDISGTAAADVDVMVIASQLAGLTYLSLKECRQVSDVGLRHLSSSHCVINGHLQYLNLGGLTRTHSTGLVQLLTARRTRALGACNHARKRDSLDNSAGHTTASAATQTTNLLHLGLSYTAGASDAVLEVFASAAAVAAAATEHAAGGDDANVLGQCLMSNLTMDGHTRQHNTPAATVLAANATGAAEIGHQQALLPPLVGLSGLELGGCNSVSGVMLQHIASLGLLQQLRVLDVSDMEDLRSPNSLSPVTRTGAAAAAVAAASTQGRRSEVPHRCGTQASVAAASTTVGAPDSILGQVFRYMGSQMASLTLDGCYVDDLTAGFVSQQCPLLEHLSVVGCRGLGTYGLHALVSSGSYGRGLRSLYVGGSSCSWKEREALSGLTSLTELRVFRRSSVTDVDLAPVLVANQWLQKLTLVGCYSLTDRLFVLATSGSSNSSVDSSTVRAPVLPAQRDLHCAVDVAPVGDLHSHWHSPLQGLGLLTQLNLTACDGVRGTSISRLRNLRSLRISFCASIDKTAIQHLVVACKNLVLLELPAQLQGQVYAQTFPLLGTVTNRRSGSQAAGGSFAGSSKLPKTVESVATGAKNKTDVLLPNQGLGGHLHGLKVVLV